MKSDLQNISGCESVPVKPLDKESVAQTLNACKSLCLSQTCFQGGCASLSHLQSRTLLTSWL